MSFFFDADDGLIIVRTELFGPSGNIFLRLALDTGATATMINAGPLATVGYDPALAPERVQVTTGSGVEFVPRLQVSQIKVLGQERLLFPVLSHTLPQSTGVDGLLGLDFLRGQRLNIDFQQGQISLS
jgi:predicted aspartyl protease